MAGARSGEESDKPIGPVTIMWYRLATRAVVIVVLTACAGRCFYGHPFVGVFPEAAAETTDPSTLLLAGLGGSILSAAGGSSTIPTLPQTLSGLAVYLRADHLALADGAPATTLQNESGQPYPFSSGSWPVYQSAGINGHPALSFSTNPIQVDVTGMTYDGFTLIFIFTNGASGGTGIIEHRSGSTAGSWSLLQCTPAWGCGTGQIRFEVQPGVQSDTADMSSATRVISIVSEAGQPALLYCDGPQIINTGAPATPANNGNLVIGDRYTGGSTFVGSIGELALYNRVLNSTDRASVENYLFSKYGLTAQPCSGL